MNPRCPSFAPRQASWVGLWLSVLAVALCQPLLAQITLDWNNSSSGQWNNPSAWTPAGPPTTLDTARFNQPGTFTVTLTTNVTVATYTQSSGSVTLALGGLSLQATTLNSGIGSVSSTPALRITNGNFQPTAFGIASNSGSTGSLTLDAGSNTTVGTGFFQVGTSGSGTLNIVNGGKLTTNIGSSAAIGVTSSGSGIVTISGSGSEWNSNVVLRVASQGTATLNILNGGKVMALTSVIAESSGGSGTVIISGAGSQFSVSSTMNVGGTSDLFPGAAANLTIHGGATANFGGQTNFRTNSVTHLNGGTLNLSTVNITPGAAFQWSSGFLQFASGATLTAPVFDWFTGGTRTLGTGKTLTVNTGTFNLAESLLVSGGSLTAADIEINAPLTVGAFGKVTATGSILLADGKVLQVDEFGILGAGTTITNGGGLIQLNGPAARVTGFTANLFGTVQGSGRFEAGLNNGTGGTIRARMGDYLTIESIGPVNNGRIELTGGTIEYTKTLSNLAPGIINGRGEFRGSTDTPGGTGLSNLGLIALSAGITDFRGRVLNTNTGRIIGSAGAVMTFHDGLTHNGAEFRLSAGSTAVAFGLVDGAGSFTGPGTFFMEGGYSPGNSPAAVEIGTNLVFGEDSILSLEIGGLIPGAEHDQLLLGPSASLAVSGRLSLSLIGGFIPAIGDSFRLLRFGGDQVSGQFADILFSGTLPGDAYFDTSTLLTDGLVTVVPEPSAGMLAITAAIFGLTMRPGRRHDQIT